AALPAAGSLADAAHSLARRRPLDERLAVVASSLDQAAARLGDAKAPGRVRGRRRPGGASVALLFPGQGSQHPGMGRDLYRHEAVFRQVVERAEVVLASTAAAGLGGLILAEPGDAAAAQRLTDTAVTQPALFVVEYALAQVLLAYGLRPEALAGHSIGEYVAACLAGVMDFEAALDLVAERGRLMASAQQGAMLALALGEEDARRLLEAGGEDVALAVVNGPRQCVAAGPEAAIAGLEAAARGLGRPAHRLAVSHAFHCALMEPILADFATAVARVELRPPAIPCLSNLSGGWLDAAEATDPGYWVRHLRHTVRFADNLALLLAEPGRILVEAGPGVVLSRLVRANGAGPERAVATQPEAAQAARSDGRASLLAGLGALWCQGVDLDWAALFADAPRRRLPLPTYPFQRRRLWIEPAAPARDCGRLDDSPAPAPAPAAAPAGPPEALATILTAWREVFGLPGIGQDDDFFALGGDSLLAVRIAGRLSEGLGCKVGVAQILAALTPAGLAAALDAGGSAAPRVREEGEL
ncbi:MAG: acyltransferase domain-containing protein, partial [Pseudomonadota bacterium]